VLEGIQTRLHGVQDGRSAVAVGGRLLTLAVRFIHGRPDLLPAVGGPDGIHPPRGDPARDHELHQVSATANLAPNRCPHPVRTVGLLAQVPGVPARAHHEMAGDEEARSGYEASLDRPLDLHVAEPLGPDIAHRGDPRPQQLTRVLRGPHHQPA